MPQKTRSAPRLSRQIFPVFGKKVRSLVFYQKLFSPATAERQMASYASDWEFGSASEEAQQAHLEQYFGVSLVRQPRWATFDFIASPATVYMDLKSRRVKHDTYPTALIGRNKVDYARANPDKNFYFVYNYTDGLFYVKYDAETFDQFYCSDYLRGSRDGIVDRPTPTIEIPRELLQPMRRVAAEATT